MNFIIEHWKWFVFGAAGLGVIIFIATGISAAVPSSGTIKAWSMQEAIFYGCGLIAIATFLGR